MTSNYPPSAYYPPPPSHLPPPSQLPASQPPPGAYRPPPPPATIAAPSPLPAAALGGAYRPPGSFAQPPASVASPAATVASPFAAPPSAAASFTRPPLAAAPPAGLGQYRPPGITPIASPLRSAAAIASPSPAQSFAPPAGIQQPLPVSSSIPARFALPPSSLPSPSTANPTVPYASQPQSASSMPRPAVSIVPPPHMLPAPATNGASHLPPAGLSRGAPPQSPYSQPPPQSNAAMASPYPPPAAAPSQPSPMPPAAASLPPPRGLGMPPSSAPPPAQYVQQPPPPQHPTYPQQPQQNGFGSPGPAVLNGLPPNAPNGALPPPHPAAAAHSGYQQHPSYSAAAPPANNLQPPYANPANNNNNNNGNGYDYDGANSQFSSTATSPYSSGQNSPAFTSQPPASYPPTSMYPSQSPQQQPKKVDRIDPRQIPRPSDLKGNVIKYYTRSGAAPPSSTADYIAIDEGNASPRFMRLTTNQIAHEQELIDTTKLSIGAIIQPLAPLGDGEEAVPVIDYATGPVRCGRCMAYVNPFFQFVDGGNSFVCSICGTKGDCPVEYRCNLDANGYRRDRQDKAELCRGSVEYVVGKEFIVRPVSDPSYLFAVDVSYAAVMSGLTAAAVDAIRHSLEVMKSNERIRAGVMTYDSTIHFYALSPPRTEPLMYVMSDIDDVFLPCPSTEVLVPLASPEHYQLLMALLDMIPLMYNKETRNEDAHSSSFGAAVAVAAECALPTGGKVLITVSSLPTQGAGALTNRDNSQLYGTEKERTLQQPASSFYHTIATKCAEHAVSIDLFICANTYVDLATLSVLSEKTGGQVFMYPSYSARKDAYAFQRDLYHDVTRVTGFDAVMIVRVSAGLRVAEHYGNFFHRTASEMDLPSIDADKTFAIRIEHDGKLKDKSEACVQCALLYTTAQGQRRIRVHTVGVPVTSALSNIYRFSDLDAIINLSLRQAARQLLDSTTPTDAQHALTSACIDSLFVYRKFCASATSAGQLILPEPLKLLPLCTLGMIKHPLLQEGVSADERSYLYSFINSMPCYVSVAFVVPRLYALHDMPPHACVYDDKGRVSLPPSLSLSSESISMQGLYLLDDARFLYLYLGADLSHQLIEDVFDGSWTLREGRAGSVAGRVQVLIATLRLQKANYQPLQLISRRTSGAAAGGESLDESLFFAHMIEDAGRGRGGLGSLAGGGSGGGGGGGSGRNGDGRSRGSEANAMSYIDFLCWIHKKIQSKFY